jgi:putative ABC transport system permease protein
MSSQRSMARSASFWESARIALDSLSKSKLRSFLTLLGIILATSTLIAVMSFVHGMNVYIATKLSDMGSNGFRIVRIAFIGNWDPKKFLEMQRRNPQLKPEEYEFIKNNTRLLSDVGLETFKSTTISYAGQTMQGVELDGVTENIPTLSDYEVGEGRMMTEEEIRRHAPFAFIGTDIRDKFFNGSDPIGKTIKADGVPYEIVGVAKAKGSVFGQSQDNFVMIPVYSFFKTYGINLNTQMAIFAKAANPDHMQEAENEARMLLRTYRHLRPNEEDTFSMFGSDTLSKAWSNMTGAIAGMAFGVVSVFLVVGGIVIMNIMLAVVTERTHEIGIRKAVGARQQDILNQFLVESAVLAVIGGLIGVALSYLLAVIVRNTTPLPMNMPLLGVVLGVGLSLIVGLFFGIYPARQAAKLDPIIALHAE